MMDWLLLGIIIVLQGLDIYTTRRALQKSCVESNPIMAWLMKRLGILPALLMTKFGFCAFLVAAIIYWPSYALTCVLGLIIAGYALVVGNNFRRL